MKKTVVFITTSLEKESFMSYDITLKYWLICYWYVNLADLRIGRFLSLVFILGWFYMTFML